MKVIVYNTSEVFRRRAQKKVSRTFLTNFYLDKKSKLNRVYLMMWYLDWLILMAKLPFIMVLQPGQKTNSATSIFLETNQNTHELLPMELMLWCPNPDVHLMKWVKVCRSDILWSFLNIYVLNHLKTSQVKVLGGTLRKWNH